jgi:quercetin dioxygenase-like cupin family protein
MTTDADPEFRVFSLDDEAGVSPMDGVHMRAIVGSGAMLNLIRLEPDAVMPLHSHPHEQIGFVLEGIQILIVDGVEHELGPHQAYVLPGGVEHAGRGGPEGCLVIDVFTPVREDYRYAAASPLPLAAS